jgi:hypothetical protein
MQYVQILDPKGPVFKGGIVGIEALTLGFILGAVLWVKVHPVVGIVGGLGGATFYGYLFTRRRVGRVLTPIVSLAWAAIAGAITLGTHHDRLWVAFIAAVVFYISWKAHHAGGQELRETGIW